MSPTIHGPEVLAHARLRHWRQPSIADAKSAEGDNDHQFSDFLEPSPVVLSHGAQWIPRRLIRSAGPGDDCEAHEKGAIADSDDDDSDDDDCSDDAELANNDCAHSLDLVRDPYSFTESDAQVWDVETDPEVRARVQTRRERGGGLLGPIDGLLCGRGIRILAFESSSLAQLKIRHTSMPSHSKRRRA